MILSKKHSVVIADLYCDEPAPDVEADVIRYNQWSTLTPGQRIPPLHTILIDLSLPLKDLQGGCEKETRYEIRRAEKDNLLVEVYREPSLELLENFCQAYNDSVAAKGLPAMNSSFLQVLAQAGAIEVSRVRQERAEPLAWHVYCWGNHRPVLQFSVSSHRATNDPGTRQLIGRANRFLHWQDMIRFQQQQVAILDMGGWYSGTENEGLLKVNQFKQQFGGKVTDIYNSLYGVTLKGKSALKLLELKRLLRRE